MTFYFTGNFFAKWENTIAFITKFSLGEMHYSHPKLEGLKFFRKKLATRLKKSKACHYTGAVLDYVHKNCILMQ